MDTCSSTGTDSVPLDPLPAAQVESGSPATGLVELPAPAGLACGVWEHAVGTLTAGSRTTWVVHEPLRKVSVTIEDEEVPT